MDGWIKLHRRILEWEWWDDPVMVKVWLRLLFDANYESKKWKGITVERGQLIFGRMEYAEKCCISERQIRTAMERLKTTGEVTIKTTNKYSLVTLTKYDLYNPIDDETSSKTTSQTTSQRPTNDQQTTTPKEIKKDKKEKKEKDTSAFARFWDAYPRKVDKIRALKAWNARIGSGCDPEAIIAGTERYAILKAGTDVQYIKHPATFLNAGSWENTEERGNGNGINRGSNAGSSGTTPEQDPWDLSKIVSAPDPNWQPGDGDDEDLPF